MDVTEQIEKFSLLLHCNRHTYNKNGYKKLLYKWKNISSRLQRKWYMFIMNIGCNEGVFIPSVTLL